MYLQYLHICMYNKLTPPKCRFVSYTFSAVAGRCHAAYDLCMLFWTIRFTLFLYIYSAYLRLSLCIHYTAGQLQFFFNVWHRIAMCKVSPGSLLGDFVFGQYTLDTLDVRRCSLFLPTRINSPFFAISMNCGPYIRQNRHKDPSVVTCKRRVVFFLLTQIEGFDFWYAVSLFTV